VSLSTVLVPILTGGGSATVITTGMGTIVARILKRIAGDVAREALAGVAKESDLKAIASDVTDLKVKFAAEVGGNSGGLRQAVNEIGTDLAELKGEFKEHVRQGAAA
jgi:hypothetical protein